MSLLPADFFDDVRSDGADIRVTKSDEVTEVAREVVWISATANAGELHFVANGTMTNSANGVFYLYYGNGDASEPAANDTYGKNNVWVNGYVGVWHLQEAANTMAGGYKDSKANYNGLGFTMSQAEVNGKLSGKAQDFSGTGDYISVGTGFPTLLTYSVTFWVKPDTAGTGLNLVVRKKSDGSLNNFQTAIDGLGRFTSSNLNDDNSVYSAVSSTSVSAGTWFYLATTYQQSQTIKLYINSSLQSTQGTGGYPPYSAGIHELMFAKDPQSGSGLFDGKLDEIRISNTVRDGNWIKTEYNNQNSPAAFFGLGTAQTDPSSAPPTVSSFSPADNATGVSVSTNLVINFDKAIDIQTGNITIKKSSDGSTVQTIAVTSGYLSGNGTTQITINPPVNLAENTSYYVLIDASAFDDLYSNSFAGIASSTTWNFTTAGGASWYDKAWPYRVKVTVNGDLINGSLTNFPVYLNLNQLPGEFFDHVRTDGGDIRVTRSNGTTLVPREVVNINTTSNAGELHFLANSLSLNTDKNFYIYYGNSEVEEPLANSQYGAYNVWNGTYSYVYHFDKKPFGVIRESSKTQLKGFSDGLMNGTHFISGMVGNGYSFDGSNDYIKSSPMNTFGSIGKATVSAWYKRSASNQNIRLGVYESAGGNIFGIGSSGGNIMGYVDNAVNTISSPSNDTSWHHASLVFNGSGATDSDKLKLYIDTSTGGNSIFAVSMPSTLNMWLITSPIKIGTITNSDYHKGSLDEVRFSTKAFSQAWVTTEYNNQNTSSYFSSSANEEESNGLAAIAFSPIDDGYSLRDDNFTITFSKIADIQTGNIVIKKAADNSTIETIDVTSGQVTGNGTTQITFNPSATLTNGTSYYVQIDSGAFKDISGNSYPGISDTTTWSFTAARWYDNNWPYRVRLTIDKDKVPGDLTNFPVYVNLNQMPGHFFDYVKTDGSDIRVTLANGIGLVAREVVKINTTANTGEMHFQAKGTLSGTSDTTYFVYYGNSKTTEPLANSQFGKYNVWNGTYNHVYHLSSAPFGEVPTSTKNQTYKGYVYSSSAMNGKNLISGIVSNGTSFDGSNDFINHGMIADFANATKATLSAWVKRESSGQEIRLGQQADMNNEVAISSTATTIKAYVDTASTVSVASNDTNWHHVIMVFNGNLTSNGDRTNMYFDSNQYLRTAATTVMNTTLPNLYGTTYPFFTGNLTSGGYHQGSIDELRIVNKAITENWAITEYNNQYSPSTFYSISSVYDLSTSPMAIAFNPIDNGYADKNQNLVITFNRAMDIQTGNVTIKKVSDDSTVEAIDVSSGQVTGDGTNTITINPATTLTNGTSYYVQIDSTAFDDTAGNSYAGIADTSTWNFTVSRWYDSSWLYRLKLTVDHNMVAGNLTSFPVYVKLGNFPDHFFNNVKADGGDIRVTLSNGLGLVPREIVRIDTTNNAGEMHFKASGTLSSTADTDFYVYYGNSGATEPAANSTFGEQKVWNGIYSYVYHLGDDPTGTNDIDDSTSSAGDGHTNGTMAAASAGQLDKALTFDGSDDLATTFSSYLGSISKFTISSWVKRNGNGYNIRMGQYESGAGYISIFSSSNTIRAVVNMTSSLGEVYTSSNDTNWHQVIMAFNGSASTNGDRLKIYFDGSSANSTSSDSVPTVTGFSMSAFYLGYAPNSWTYHRGMIDETRTTLRVLSPEWILTEYRNQSSPNSFYSVAGTPASTLDVDAPVITSFSPADNASGVGLTSNLVLTFNEAVSLQTGNIVIYNGAGAVFESVDVQTAAVTGDGTNTITINPAGTLATNSTYYVLIAGTVIEDASGNAFAGIGSSTTWNFSTNDATAPTVLNYSPAHNAILTQRFAGLGLIFSEAVQAGAGNIVIKKVSDDNTVQTISIASATISGNQVLIPMPSKLPEGIQLYVQIDSGAVEDLSGNAYAGISNTSTWRFRTSTAENSLFF